MCVIIPTFNRAELLRDALDSLRAQTMPCARVIVVDDGSTDETELVVAGYGGWTDYMRKTNGGKSAALNTALARTDEPFIWIFDDDDRAHPTALERLYTALIHAKDAAFAFGAHDEWQGDKRGRTTRPARTPAPQPTADLHLALLDACSILQPGMLIRRERLIQAGPFDEELFRSQDYDMLLRLTRRWRCVRVPGIVFHQRQHGGTRGPAHMSVPVARRSSLWAAFDRIIFHRIYLDYALEEYLPAALRADPAAGLHAIIRRMSLMGHRGLWKEASADIHATGVAAKTCGVRRLDAAGLARLDYMFHRNAPGLATLRPLSLVRTIWALPTFAMRWQLLSRLLVALPFIPWRRMRARLPVNLRRRDRGATATSAA